MELQKETMVNETSLGISNADSVAIVSWNILNPNSFVSKFTYSSLGKEKMTLYGKMEQARFCFRVNYLMKIILNWLKNPKTIICLQEVTQEMIDILIVEIGAHRLRWSEHDIIKNNGRLINKYEYRVTIIGKDYDFIEHKSIALETSTSIKPCLFTQIINNKTQEQFCVCNIHINHNSETHDYARFAEMIKTEINEKDFYICGDFNANFQDERFMAFNAFFQKPDDHYLPASFNNPDKFDFTGVDINGDSSKGLICYPDNELGVYVNVIDHIISNKIGTRLIIDSSTYSIMIDIVAIDIHMNSDIRDCLERTLLYGISDHLPIVMLTLEPVIQVTIEQEFEQKLTLSIPI
jgi:hypothetical protein